ncbi:MAG: transcriptional repressor [Verrucomicrobia bacterium]|nr:transcriptional repressor [Verrucomicrobiota bacterium]
MIQKTANDLQQTLRERGWRMTRQRQAVYDAVLASRDHPSAEEVFQRVRRKLPDVSLATVYNSLEALVECGQVAKVPRSDDGPARYSHRLDPHHHARCIACGQVWDLEEQSLDIQPRATGSRFRPVAYKVEMLVECPRDCGHCASRR